MKAGENTQIFLQSKTVASIFHSIIFSIFMLFFYTRDTHGCLGHVTMVWRFVSAWILNSFASSSNRDRITKQTNSCDSTIIPGATRTSGLPLHPDQLTGDGSPRKTGRGRGGGTTVACQSRDGRTCKPWITRFILMKSNWKVRVVTLL